MEKNQGCITPGAALVFVFGGVLAIVIVAAMVISALQGGGSGSEWASTGGQPGITINNSAIANSSSESSSTSRGGWEPQVVPTPSPEGGIVLQGGYNHPYDDASKSRGVPCSFFARLLNRCK
jgi:hypothetical protein